MKITVLCGGLSPERNVSLSTGARVCTALRSLGHRASLVDMYLGVIAGADEPVPDFSRTAETEPDLDAVRRSRDARIPGLIDPSALDCCRSSELVFLALHGQCGEDGRIQALLELLGIPYTGSGYMASALAMDKRLTKLMAERVGVLTPESCFYRRGEAVDYSACPVPCVVKPVNSGSSIGVEVVRDRSLLPAACERASQEGDGVLIERYITGRDVQISVLGGRALPSIEILPGDGFYDYRNKYVAGASVEITPAPVPPETEAALAEAALAVYRALGLRSLARADFILDGEGRLWFLEINTLPGMTPTSLAPQEAAAAGISYENLCAEMIELALEDCK